MEIGFIGIGVMGKSMAANLIKAGHSISVHTRTKSKADGLLESGAKWKGSLLEFTHCEIIITMLGYPKDVSEVYLGKQGLINNVKSGCILIDMTTSSPALAKEIYEAAKINNIGSLDAPVSGGDVGAREAKLSIMVGGNIEDYSKAENIFSIMGNPIHQGSTGYGQYTKLCNQIAVAAGMLGVCESLTFAEKSGLDPEIVLASIQSGAAGSWALSNLAPRILNSDFQPGFFVKHFIKDLKITLESAQELNLDLPGLKLAHQLYQKLSENGGDELGTQALYQLYH